MMKYRNTAVINKMSDNTVFSYAIKYSCVLESLNEALSFHYVIRGSAEWMREVSPAVSLYDSS